MNLPERDVQKTTTQYDAALAQCQDIFAKKTRDYGTAWRVLRPISIVDQIFIKAQRIRTIQEKGKQKVDVSATISPANSSASSTMPSSG
jgi:hypothetical protein